MKLKPFGIRTSAATARTPAREPDMNDRTPLLQNVTRTVAAAAGTQTQDSEPEGSNIRIVLVGKTGVGKSATGNTILRKNDAFLSKMSAATVTSVCYKETGEFEGQNLEVVDTPGLYDTFKTEEEVKWEIFKCMSFLAPGPHVFLVVIRPDRFTEQEQRTVELIKETFGEKAADYTMMVFTRGDELQKNRIKVETFISESQTLFEVIKKCKGGYHVFNNETKDPSQVRKLLEKIDEMVQKNEVGGRRYYTNDLLGEAERTIREKMKEILVTNPHMKICEIRKKAEKNNKFLYKYLGGGIAVGTAVGVGSGLAIDIGVCAGIGAVGGPVGMVVGAALGLVGGLGAANIAKKVKKDCCRTQ